MTASDFHENTFVTNFLSPEAAKAWRDHLAEPELRIPIGEFRHYAKQGIAEVGPDMFAIDFCEKARRLGLDSPAIVAGVTAIGDIADGEVS
jgi:hypothetical protein